METAEEKLLDIINNKKSYDEDDYCFYFEGEQIVLIREAMIEFAKMHVEAALKQANINQKLERNIDGCYPLENIK